MSVVYSMTPVALGSYCKATEGQSCIESHWNDDGKPTLAWTFRDSTCVRQMQRRGRLPSKQIPGQDPMDNFIGERICKPGQVLDLSESFRALVNLPV